MSPSPLEGREKGGREREGRRREEREGEREVKGGEEREGSDVQDCHQRLSTVFDLLFILSLTFNPNPTDTP